MYVLWRGSLAQRVRLGTGLVLFVFAATHFFNHALGLFSLQAMVEFDHWRTAITRSVAGALVLAFALIVHAGAALVKVAQRRSFRLPGWEWLQLALGLAIPLLLLPHVVNTRISNLAFGIDTSYPYELRKIWTDTMLDQSLLLLLVWVHGCLGLHYWLRLARGYRVIGPYLLVAAALLPFAALLGVVTQGREMAALTANPAAFAALKASTHWPDAATEATIIRWRADARIGFYAIAALAVLLGVARTLQQRRAMRIPVQYVSGPLVKAAEGPTLLEVSRMHRIPHMSVCGGRGRCSTCRVMVFGEEAALAPASEAELQTLRSVGAAANVRLACQARVRASATIMPLVRLGTGADIPVFVHDDDEAGGVERELAVLFVDMRGFTALTEQKLPYDVVYLLNNFFHSIGQAVYGNGGWVNDRAGDGVLAVFGAPAGLGAACRSALLACAEVDRLIGLLNVRMEGELAQPLRVAMGLHCGTHVHGRIGVGIGDSLRMSVVGPAVNVASRLEAVAKQAEVQLAVSAEVTRHAGLDTAGLASESVAIRGVRQPVDVLLVAHARDLLTRFRSVQAAA
jgi:adenylate cyclase